MEQIEQNADKYLNKGPDFDAATRHASVSAAVLEPPRLTEGKRLLLADAEDEFRGLPELNSPLAE